MINLETEQKRINLSVCKKIEMNYIGFGTNEKEAMTNLKTKLLHNLHFSLHAIQLISTEFEKFGFKREES